MAFHSNDPKRVQVYDLYMEVPLPLPEGRQFFQDDCDTAFKRGYTDPTKVAAVAGSLKYAAWAAGRDRGRIDRKEVHPKYTGNTPRDAGGWTIQTAEAEGGMLYGPFDSEEEADLWGAQHGGPGCRLRAINRPSERFAHGPSARE